MNKSIERRLAALERRLSPLVPAFREIVLRGGLPGSDDPTFASAGNMRWQRAADESFNAFRARVVTVATAAGQRFIVFGGLPGPELIASGYLQRHHPELCE